MATADLSWLEVSPGADRTMTAAGGSFTLTGGAATLTGPGPATASVSWLEVGPPVSSRTLTADAGAFVLSGAPSTAGYDMYAAAGAFALSGGSATLTGPAFVDPTADAVWSYVMANGQTAEENLLELLTKVNELHRIHGLNATYPLSVTSTSRSTGSISQSIADAAGVVTVTRQ